MEKLESKPFNATEFAQNKAREMKEKLEKPQEEEVAEEAPEPQDEPVETPEEIPEEEVIQEEKVEEEISDRERQLLEEQRALKRELARAKSLNREQRLKLELPEISTNIEEEEESVKVTKAEAALYNGWREEALEKFVETHPEYTTNPRLKKAFEQECRDRLPELMYAKRNNVPVTPKLFKERFDRIHRAVSDTKSVAMEEGKSELLQAQSSALVMAAGAVKGVDQNEKEQPKPKNILFKKSGDLTAWLSKKPR